MNRAQKILLSFLALVLLSVTAFAPAAQAAAPWWRPTFIEYASKIGTDPAVGGSPANEIFGERYTTAQVSWIINSLILIVAGGLAECQASADIVTCLQNFTSGSVQGGPILAVASGIDAFQTTRPASGVDYVAQKLNKFNIVQTANAQEGYGFATALQPIQKLWVASRNAAYALSTIAILVLAFMIMFRQKISPQAVVTAQSALPKLAIALLGITFSYAIAGFIVDLAYVVQGLIAATVSASGISSLSPVEIFEKLNDGARTMLSYAIAFIVTSFSGGGILSRAVNLGNGIGADLIKGSIFSFVDTILAIVVLLVLLLSMIRILWLMLLTYGKVVFLVIAGPFVALLAVVNMGGGIGGWIKQLAAQMAVFVSIGVIIMFAHILFFSFGNGAAGGINLISLGTLLGWDINTYGIDTGLAAQGAGRFPSGFSFTDTAAIGFFVSLAVILSIPKLASAVRDQILTGRGGYGFGIGEAISPVTGLASAPISRRASVTEAMARAQNISPYEVQGRGRSYAVGQGVKWLMGRASKM